MQGILANCIIRHFFGITFDDGGKKTKVRIEKL
jgi:hypothetical protein